MILFLGNLKFELVKSLWYKGQVKPFVANIERQRLTASKGCQLRANFSLAM